MGLAEDLTDYQVDGVPVKVLFGGLGYPATVVREAGAYAELWMLVELDEPVAFETHAGSLSLDEPRRRTLREQLERERCLDGERISCLWVRWMDLEVVPSAGSFAEYMEPDPELIMTCKGLQKCMWTLPGIVADPMAGLTALRLFDPVAFVNLPSGVVRTALEPAMAAPLTRMLGPRTHAAWTDASPDTLPAGNPAGSGKGYALRVPMEIAELESFCGMCCPDDRSCVIESLEFLEVLLDLSGAGLERGLRPLRSETAKYYAELL